MTFEEYRDKLKALGFTEDQLEKAITELQDAAFDVMLLGNGVVQWKDGELTRVDPKDLKP